MVRKGLRAVQVLALAGTFASGAKASNIDEIAYLTSRALKELSTRAVAMIGTANVGLCGRRRELKITGRGAREPWADIIQAALKRDQPSKKSVRINPVGRTPSSVDAALNRLLLSAGYHSEIPSEADESVKQFKAGLKANHDKFSLFSGQVHGFESGHAFAFLALADEAHNELLILSLGEELCR